MHRTLLLCLVGTACHVTTATSNVSDPRLQCGTLSPADGGVDRSVASGTGTLESVAGGRGDLPFPVRAAYQWRQADESRPGSTWLSFGLYSESISCAHLNDAGVTGQVVAGLLFDPVAQVFGPGAYPVYLVGAPEDGGRYSVMNWTQPDGGFGRVLAGTVTLSAVAPCSMSGSLEAMFERPDGSRVPINGSFGAAYCE